LKFCLSIQHEFDKKDWKEDLKDFSEMENFKLFNKVALKHGKFDSVDFNLKTGKLDYFGRDIYITSRIIDICPGGLIITDDSTFKLCRADFDFESKNMKEFPIRGTGKSETLHLIKH
jgi:hypothetical protein